MKKVFILMLTAILLSGCATMSARRMRESQAGNLTRIFENTKEEIFKAAKIALQQTDLIVRKEHYEEGTIVVTPNRVKSIAKRIVPGAIFGPLVGSSYIGLYFYITPLEDDTTKVEIVQTYDNPLNPGKDYKTELMMKIVEVLSLSKKD